MTDAAIRELAAQISRETVYSPQDAEAFVRLAAGNGWTADDIGWIVAAFRGSLGLATEYVQIVKDLNRKLIDGDGATGVRGVLSFAPLGLTPRPRLHEEAEISLARKDYTERIARAFDIDPAIIGNPAPASAWWKGDASIFGIPVRISTGVRPAGAIVGPPAPPPIVIKRIER